MDSCPVQSTFVTTAHIFSRIETQTKFTETIIGDMEMTRGFFLTILISIISLYSYFKKENDLKSDNAINIFKRVYCPSCHKKMPIMRSPKNKYQKKFGGWTCKNCGTMMNKWGQEIDAEGYLIKSS